MASSGPEKADCSQIISSTSPGGVPGDSGGSSTRPTLKITLLGSEWNSSAGGLSTFNRELAIHLSEHPQVDVTLLVPEGACKDEEKNEARRYGVNVVDAKFQAGFDPLYWLSCPPKDLHIDIVIGHGIKLGPQVQIIRNCVQFSTCKWVQVVHTAPEDLSKFKNYSDPTSKGETKYQVEIDLCKRADLVVPVGPRLTNSYSGKLRRWKKETDIFTFTPGLFQREFGDLEQVANNNEDFKVLIVGRGDTEDFELKGLDIAAKAFADKRLKYKPYELTFVGAPEGKQEEVRDRLLQCGIAKEQLTVRRFVQSRDRMKDLLCEADLAIMPSKSEGFGLVAVEALSAGLPILVSKRSGFAKAIDVVPYGYLCVVDSYDPAEWAKAIDAVRSRHAMRLKEILAVKASYGEMYSWKEQCEALVERMWQMVQGNESMNMRQKSDAPDEKHEEACRTSEQRHPFEKREKTLGTNEAESSPKKEPLENWWPSLSESTSDPGNENMNMRQKCDTPAEKLEEACRTSEQRQPFEKREKTLGTNEAESSPKKEPLENWWPSLSGSTPDPESSKGSLAEGESKNGDALSPVISTNDGKSSRDGKPDQSERANGVEAQLGGSRAGCIKKTDPYKGTGTILKRRKKGNSRKPETSSSNDPWAKESGETEILPVQESTIWSTMPNYVQTETIDQIDDLGEVFELMRKFRISGKGCNSMEALKARLKDEWSKKTYAFQAEQISRNFSVLSGAVKEDVRKRKQLLDFYTEAHVFLDKMDGQMFTSLQKRMKYIKENMKKHIQQLKRTDYFLLVLGETSSGKSSLINLILGKEILPRTILSTPPTICELKFGKQPEMVVHFKDKDPETGETTKKIPVNKPNDPSSYLEQISTYVFNDGSMFKRVELFWPHDLLQNGIVIIESPGLGESKEMDDMVIQYLLEDFAFIYVTNSANAGGFREDIFKRFLQRAKDMHLGASKVGEDGNEVSLDVQEHLLSKCALFVCNKIDQVPEREMQFFKNHTTKKLQRIFPGVDPESQIVYMSSTRGTLEAQKCGTISKEFSFFVDRMRSVVSEHMDTKLEFQWEWLYMLLSKVVIQAEAFRVNASKQIEDSLEGDIKPHKLLFGNRGNLYEARQRYQAIVDEGSRHKNQLSLFGIKSISAIQIKREEFDWKEQLFSPLVEGAFGAIFLGTVRRHGETKAVALKVSNLEPDGQNASRLMDEIKIRRMLIHPHIVKFYGISLDTNTSRTALVMKKCKENLRGHILSGLESVPGKSENPAVVLEVCRLAKEITDGLAFIHAKGVVHRNLTLENILLSVENLVKISGFSLAILETEAIGTLVGTPIYMAPEVIQSHVYSTKADIYSLGLLMWEMWYGQWAFGDGISPAVVFSWVCSGSRPVDRQGCKPPPFLWKQLMTQCWEPNPDKRPTAQNCMDTLTSLQVELERKSKYSAVRKAMNWFVS